MLIVKTILFDLDGTVVDSLQLFIMCAEKLAEEYNQSKIEYDDSMRHLPLREILAKKVNVPFYKIPKVVKEMKLLINETITDVKAFKGIIPVMRKLSKKHKIAIVTSNSKKATDIIIKKFGINFLEFVEADISLFGKSNAIKKIIKKRKLNKNNLIYVGDEVRDIEACKKIGIQIISVTWGFNSEKVLKQNKPNYLAKKPEDLLRIIS